MPSTQAVAPSPGYSRDGSEKVWMFKRTHRHKPFDRQRFMSVLWLCHAQMRDLVEVWAHMGECLPPVRECSPPVRKCSPPDRSRSIFLVQLQTFVNFALSLPGLSPLSLSSSWTMTFFSETTKKGQETKLSSKCPTSAIASPHVKYVKGCSLKSQWEYPACSHLLCRVTDHRLLSPLACGLTGQWCFHCLDQAPTALWISTKVQIADFFYLYLYHWLRKNQRAIQKTCNCMYMSPLTITPAITCTCRH